jgi:hypothetical protein
VQAAHFLLRRVRIVPAPTMTAGVCDKVVCCVFALEEEAGYYLKTTVFGFQKSNLKA